MKRKLVTLLCVLALAVSLLPVVAAAADVAKRECPKGGECDIFGKTEIVPANCKHGQLLISYCSKCGKESERKDDGNVQPHQRRKVAGKAATCTDSGFTQHEKCDWCGKEFDKQELTAGHDWGEWTVTQEPTCTAEGKRQHTCQRVGCGKTGEEAIPAKDHKPAVTAQKENAIIGDCNTEQQFDLVTYCMECGGKVSREHVNEGLQHKGDIVEEIVEGTKPTCTEYGRNVKVSYCSNCKKLVSGPEEVQGGKPLGHDVKDWTVTVEPTCVKEGKKEGKCQSCGATETETVPATGVHVWDESKTEVTERVEPTCKEAGGNWIVKTCQDCGEKSKPEFVKTDDPTGKHTYVCEAADSKTHRNRCTTCGELGNVENHKFVSKVIREATAKQKGLRQYTCKGCDYSYTVEFAYDPTLDDVPKTGDSMGIALITGLSLCMAAVLPLKKWMR